MKKKMNVVIPDSSEVYGWLAIPDKGLIAVPYDYDGIPFVILPTQRLPSRPERRVRQSKQ